MPQPKLITSKPEFPDLRAVLNLKQHPFIDRTVNSFLKIGLVGAAHAGVQETFSALKKESLSRANVESALKKITMEGLQWGVIAGVYTGMEYGMQQGRGTHDWKNAMCGGALTGGILTLNDSRFNKDRMLRSAATGAAIATAAELIAHHLHHH